MASESPGHGPGQRARHGWRAWARLGAAAFALLLLSEALWLWQTWPVRELLLPPAPTRTVTQS